MANTLEELEVVVKGNVKDAISKLELLKSKINEQVNGASKQLGTSFAKINTSAGNMATGSIKQMDLLGRRIELQRQKVAKLDKEFRKTLKVKGLGTDALAKNYAKQVSAGNITPNNEYMRLESAQLQLDKMQASAMNTGKQMEKPIKKAMDNIAKSTEKATKHTNKLVLSFKRLITMMIIRKVIRAAIEGFQDLAKYSSRFNQTMSTMQGALLQTRNSISTAFAPILQALAPIVEAVANAITNLFTALARINTILFTNNKTFTKAKKVTTDYAKSVDKAKGSLAGFDELNVISNQGQDGMPSASEMFEEETIDPDNLTGFSKWAYDLKQQLSGIDLTNLTNSFDKLKKSLEPFTRMFFDGLYWFKDNILVPFTTWMIEEAIPKFFDALATALDFLYGVLQTIKPYLEWLWENFLKPVAEWTGGIIVTVFNEINKAFQTGGANIKEYIDNAKKGDTVIGKFLIGIEKLWNLLVSIWENFLVPIFKNLADMLVWLWNEHLQPLYEKVVDFIGTVINCVLDLWNNTLAPVLTWLVDTLGPQIANVVNVIVNVVGTIVGAVADVIGGIITALKGIIEFITGIFTLNWEQAWTGIKDFFKGIWDGIVGIVKGAINLVIDVLNGLLSILETALNWIVDKINDMKISNPFNGEEIWSPNIPRFDFGRIPKLAKGGILTSDTLFIGGEYAGAESNPEIVSPQSLMYETNVKANIPVMNAIEEMSDNIVGALNSLGLYAEFDYDKLRVGLKKEDERMGKLFYGGAYV